MGHGFTGYARSNDAKKERFVKKSLEVILKEVSAMLRQQQDL